MPHAWSLHSTESTAEAKLKYNLTKNPFFPFDLIVDSPHGRLFTLRRPYWRKKIAIAVGIVSLFLIILFASLDMVETSYFMYPVVIFVLSCGFAYTYRHVRLYKLDENSRTYSFTVANKVLYTTSCFHAYYARKNPFHWK